MILAQVNLGSQKRNINCKTFNIINTYEYCGDMGSIIVECESANDLDEYGFDTADCNNIERLDVGEVYESYDYGKGCLVVRMA